MTLHSRANATGEIALRILILLLLVASNRHHVRHSRVGGIDRGEDVVEQRTFVKVSNRRIGPDGEQLPAQLQHVVHVARLRRAPVHA